MGHEKKSGLPWSDPNADVLGDIVGNRRRMEVEYGYERSSITCPRCGMTSYNPNDIKFGWCGNCHDYTRVDEQPTGPMQGLRPHLMTVDEILQYVPTPISKNFGEIQESTDEVEENSPIEEDPDLWHHQRIEEDMAFDAEEERHGNPA